MAFMNRCNIRRFSHSLRILKTTNILQENLCRHLIEKNFYREENLKYTFDVVKSFKYIFNYHSKSITQHRKYAALFNLKILLKYFNLDTLDCSIPKYDEKCRKYLTTFFDNISINQFNLLFWAQNADYYFEKLIISNGAVLQFAKDRKYSNRELVFFNMEGVKISMGAKKDVAFTKLILHDDFLNACSDLKTKFALTEDVISEIHERKSRLDKPLFTIAPKFIRTVTFDYSTDPLGFKIFGGELICQADDKFYEKYSYCPVFIEHVEPNSPADNLGLKIGDRIVALNYCQCNAIDLETFSCIMQRIMNKEKSLVMTLEHDPDGYEINQKLVDIYKQKRLHFDPEPKSDHPRDIARKNTRPLWRMTKNKKLKEYVPSV